MVARAERLLLAVELMEVRSATKAYHHRITKNARHGWQKSLSATRHW